MNSQLLSSSPCLSLLCFLLVILLKIQSSSSSNSSIDSFCRAPFKCGKIIAVYPFWGGARREPCGHPQFKLDCRGFPNNLTTMMINDVNYRVLEINQEARTLRIANLMLQSFPRSRPCPKSPYTTFNSEHFNYSGAYENVTLHYGCVENGSCIEDGVIYEDDFIPNGIKYVSRGCNANVSVPVPRPLLPEAKTNWSDWEEVLNQGIELKWKKIGGMACEDCTNSKGTCGNDPSSNETICFCPDIFHGPCPYNTPDQAPQAPPGSGRVLVGALIILSILLISGVARKLIWDENYSKKKETVERNQNRDMKAFVRNFGSILPQKFKYSDVKKMTKSFSNKLGQGGYGDVYQGKLADGRLVAVKLLKESKGNGEEFINEVASICRTSHVNIVTLLGFCYTRNKRALIYEFMSNGSLDKFIFDKESSSTNHNLEWKTRHQVAIGIARGLEYLHRGCSTRIVHFDIKPHNILLDEDFCPKISDFGLAKLCKQKESVISMIGARGTAGYIAPEVFSRTFGEVSHKSDVYSYGMMVLEMVAGRKNIDALVSHTSEIYFPNWIYKRLEPGKDFEFHGVITEEEKEMAKKMIIVSMWCIQTIPSDRPSMGKVLEMFEYSLESLQVPPKPSLSVPARTPKHSIPLSSFSTSTPSHKPASQEEIRIDLSDN